MPLNGMVCGPASSLMLTLEMASRVGGSFTGLTTSTKLMLALLALVLLTFTVTTAKPN